MTVANITSLTEMSSKPKTTGFLDAPLPEQIIPGTPLTVTDSETYIRQVLKNDLPHSEKQTFSNDLKWKFVLEKHTTRKKKRSARKTKTFLTRKERKEINLLKLRKKGWNYESLRTINEMWRQYVRDTVDLTNIPSCADNEWNTFGPSVAKIEFIGADVSVTRSKTPSLVGLAGIVVLETKMTFQIVTSRSELKIVPKEACVFVFGVDKVRFTIFGKNLLTRPSERTSKKIKSQMLPDL